MKICSVCHQSKPISDFYENKFTLDRLGSQCKECDTAQCRERRQKNKEEAVKTMGGECLVCGYDRCFWALEFHHVDPSKKDVSIQSLKRNWDRICEELRKCVLVCSNCHREIHAGIIDCPNLPKYNFKKRNRANKNVRKLTEGEVVEIRKKYVKNIYSYQRLASEYKIGKMSIKKIIDRKTYVDVQ